MSKLLSMEEITNIIYNYIQNYRINQAILLNGEWGCGKTFFIKNKLIPYLLEQDNQVLSISLYGVSKIEKVQDMIYGQWIKNVVQNKTQKLGPFGNLISKGIDLFGSNAIKFVENRKAEVVKGILKKKIGKLKNIILIFDDIERCQINILELMGFLNNLSENNEFKIIMVANEKEIDKYEDDIPKLKTDNVTKKDSDNTAYESNQLNNRKSKYQRTKEKLIGLTILYNIPIRESFDEIIKEYITNTDIQDIVLNNKEKIIELFQHEKHRNLRSLITACTAIENIISSLDQEKISNKEYFQEELNLIVRYIVYSSIRKANGTGEYNRSYALRFGIVNENQSNVQHIEIYRYAFIDEYWETLCMDKDAAYSDINASIKEKITINKTLKSRRKHESLALNHLKQWYLLEDKEVEPLIQQTKKELSKKQYFPQEFKGIILTLMHINNPNFGLNSEESQTKSSLLFDSADPNLSFDIIDNTKKNEPHQYNVPKTDISEFVNLMVQYFDDEQFVLTKEMIYITSSDNKFVCDYIKLIMPIIKKIEEKELRTMSTDKDGNLVSEIPWDSEFEEYCHSNSACFITKGRFLSMFDYNKLIKRLIEASPKEVYNLYNGLREIYSFSSFSDIYFADYEIIKSINNYFSKDSDSLNENKSRNKAIVLNTLYDDLKKYENELNRKKLGSV